MGKNKKCQYQMCYDNPPETLDDTMFFGMTLDPEQVAFRDAIWNKEKVIVLCDSKAGSGKAQPIDTLIPTPNGDVKLGDLRVGDYVFDRYGNPTEILGVYPQGKQRAYKVVLHDGRSTVCGPEHLWTYTTDGCNYKLRTETLSEMLKRPLTTPSGAARYQIPNNEAVDYPTKEFKIDPYVLGVFISDGCCTCDKLTLSSNEFSIVNAISRTLKLHPVKWSKENYNWNFKDDNGHVVKTDELFEDYSEYIMTHSYNKRIPPEYLYGDVYQRYALLQGLMDTDGTIGEKERYNVRFTTTSAGLVKDIQHLANSLGLSISITEDHRENKYTNDVCYGIYFRVPNSVKVSLFRNSVKLVRASESIFCKKTRRYDYNRIYDIIDLGYETEMVCIFVDNPEHLYLTNDYIVTHNTMLSTAVATLLVKYGFYDGIVYVMSPTQEQAQGYLPGSIEEKSAPYMQPLFDALTAIGEDPVIAIKSDDNIQAQKDGRAYIDVCTDTFMRGINLEHKVVIIDEAQNFYFDQLKKVLTRIHDNSKTIVIGSSIQCDIIKHPERSGFVPYIKAFEKSGSEKCEICKLTKNYRGWLSNFADGVMLNDYIN